MAAPSPKPAARGGPSRLQIAGRLTALIGLPVTLILLIFSGGLYVGATRSYRVQLLEARWLGFAPPGQAGTGEGAAWGEDGGEPPPGAESAGEGEGEDAGETKGAPAADTEGAPAADTEGAPAADTDGPDTPPDTDQNPPVTDQNPAATGRLPIATADPIGPELRSRFDESLVVRVKILVDPALVVAREDWLTYTAGLVDATRASFERLFGVDVQLQGIVIWDEPAGTEPAALLADLAARERGSADVILGLVARPEPAKYETQLWSGDVHGDHALVFADLQQEDRYYRNLLRTLATLLGAEPAVDAPSKSMGSFMSDAEPPAGTAPVIDPENRGRVIIGKRRPFTEAGADTPDDGGDHDDDDEPKPKKNPKQRKGAKQPEEGD